jgi:hypothetical protein
MKLFKMIQRSWGWGRELYTKNKSAILQGYEQDEAKKQG